MPPAAIARLTRRVSTLLLTGVSTVALGGIAWGACPAPGAGIVVNGTTATESGCAISTGAASTPGANANLGGVLNLSDSSISTTAGGSYGAYANGAGSTVNLMNVGISTSAANGVFVNGGVVEMEGGSILVTGASTNGVHMIGVGGSVILTDVGIRAQGNSGVGLFVQLGGNSVTMQGGSITTTANGGRGVDVGLGAGAASSVILENVTLDVAQGAGPSSFGAIVARNGSTVELTDSIVKSQVYGLHSIAGGARIDVINSSIEVTANTAVFGAYAQNATTITLDNSVVTTTGGTNAHGLVAQDGSTVEAKNNTAVETSGTNAQGAFLIAFSVGSEITLSDSLIATSGAGASAVLFSANAGLTNSFEAKNSTLSASAADMITVSGGIADIDLTDVAAAAASSQRLLLVDGSNPATANLAAWGSTLAGDMQVVVGNTANVRLLAATEYTGATLAVTNLVVDASLWNMTASSTVTNQLTNAGFINSVFDGGNFKTLTVNGSYVGNDGGMALNTFLGGDGSPSDLLVVNGGTATGATMLRITNAGAAGARTTGDGIRVVDALNGGATAPDSFALNGLVIAGAYDYQLFRGGLDGMSDPDDWFLRSTERPETSLYAVIPALAGTYGRAMLATLDERIGADEHLRGRADLDPDPYWNGRWGRLIAQYGNHDGDSRGILAGDPDYDFVLGALQVGQDIYRGETSDGNRNAIGAYGAIGMAKADVTHLDGADAGTDELTAYTIGGYWTHYGRSGAYLDAVVQGTWYDVSGRSSRDLPNLDTQGWGFAGSLEGGYPVALAGGWSIEPQGQLVIQTIDIDSADEEATEIGFQDADSLTGRIGARVARSWHAESDDQRLRTVWIRPSLWHDFLDGPTTEFAGEGAGNPARFEIDPVETWLEINAGLDAELSATQSVYANVSLDTDFSGEAYAVSGKAGFKARW